MNKCDLFDIYNCYDYDNEFIVSESYIDMYNINEISIIIDVLSQNNMNDSIFMVNNPYLCTDNINKISRIIDVLRQNNMKNNICMLPEIFMKKYNLNENIYKFYK